MNFHPTLEGRIPIGSFGTPKIFRLSQRLKISRRTLQDYRNNGILPYRQLGGKILYRESDIERVLQSCYRGKF